MGSFAKLLDETMNNKYITLNQLHDAIKKLQEIEPEHVDSADLSNNKPVVDASNNKPMVDASNNHDSNIDSYSEDEDTSKNIDLSLLALLLSHPSSTSAPSGPTVSPAPSGPTVPPAPSGPVSPVSYPEPEDNANLSLLTLLDIPHKSDNELSEPEEESKHIDLSLLTLLLSNTQPPNGPPITPQPEPEDNANISLLTLLDIPDESDESDESDELSKDESKNIDLSLLTLLLSDNPSPEPESLSPSEPISVTEPSVEPEPPISPVHAPQSEPEDNANLSLLALLLSDNAQPSSPINSPPSSPINIPPSSSINTLPPYSIKPNYIALGRNFQHYSNGLQKRRDETKGQNAQIQKNKNNSEMRGYIDESAEKHKTKIYAEQKMLDAAEKVKLAQARLAEERTLAEAQAKANAEERTLAEAQAKANAEAEQARLAEERTLAEAQAKANAETRTLAEAQARLAEAEQARLAEAEQARRAEAEQARLAEAQAKANAEARTLAEAQAKANAETRTLAEAQAKANAEAQATAAAQAKALEAKASQEAEQKIDELPRRERLELISNNKLDQDLFNAVYPDGSNGKLQKQYVKQYINRARIDIIIEYFKSQEKFLINPHIEKMTLEEAKGYVKQRVLSLKILNAKKDFVEKFLKRSDKIYNDIPKEYKKFKEEIRITNKLCQDRINAVDMVTSIERHKAKIEELNLQLKAMGIPHKHVSTEDTERWLAKRDSRKKKNPTNNTRNRNTNRRERSAQSPLQPPSIQPSAKSPRYERPTSTGPSYASPPSAEKRISGIIPYPNTVPGFKPKFTAEQQEINERRSAQRNKDEKAALAQHKLEK